MTWREASCFDGSSGVLASVALGSDNQIFYGTSSGWIIVSSADGDILTKKPIHSKGINQMAISKDNQYILTCSDDTTCALVAISELTKVITYTGSLGKLVTCDISPHSDLMAAAGEDMMIHIWFADEENHATFISAHTDVITAIKFNQTGDFVITSSLDGLCRVWALCDTQIVLLRTLFSVDVPIMDAILVPSEKFVLTSSSDGILRLYELQNNKLVAEYEGSAKGMMRSTIKWRGDGDNIELIATFEGKINIWNFCTKELILSIEAGQALCALEISGDGNLLVACDPVSNRAKIFTRED